MGSAQSEGQRHHRAQRAEHHDQAPVGPGEGGSRADLSRSVGEPHAGGPRGQRAQEEQDHDGRDDRVHWIAPVHRDDLDEQHGRPQDERVRDRLAPVADRQHDHAQRHG